MIKFHIHLAECLDLSLSVGSITAQRLAHHPSPSESQIQEERALSQLPKVSPLVVFFLDKGNSDVSLLLMIPIPFAKLCEVDERIHGQPENLFCVTVYGTQ
jgi:hypothetical protein